MRSRFNRLALALALAGLLGWAGSSSADDSTLKVKEGQKAPDIELPATQVGTVLPEKKDAKTLSLKDLQGKKHVVLFFYPKAMTPGCTIESCGFRDRTAQLAKLDTVVIGISTDTLAAQEQFTAKEKLNFPLLADDQQKAAKTLGVLMPGRPVTQRVTFIIDKEGTIRKIYDKVNAKTHPEEVVEYVKANLATKK